MASRLDLSSHATGTQAARRTTIPIRSTVDDRASYHLERSARYMSRCSVAEPQESSSNKARVRDYRARLRAQGLRPVQIWVPDVRSPLFAEEAHRQSVAVASSECAGDDQAFIDAVSDSDSDSND